MHTTQQRCAHTHIHIWIHTTIHTSIHADTHIQLRSNSPASRRASCHTGMKRPVGLQVYTTHQCSRTHTHTPMDTHTTTLTHAHLRTHIYEYALHAHQHVCRRTYIYTPNLPSSYQSGPSACRYTRTHQCSRTHTNTHMNTHTTMLTRAHLRTYIYEYAHSTCTSTCLQTRI